MDSALWTRKISDFLTPRPTKCKGGRSVKGEWTVLMEYLLVKWGTDGTLADNYWWDCANPKVKQGQNSFMSRTVNFPDRCSHQGRKRSQSVYIRSPFTSKIVNRIKLLLIADNYSHGMLNYCLILRHSLTVTCLEQELGGPFQDQRVIVPEVSNWAQKGPLGPIFQQLSI